MRHETYIIRMYGHHDSESEKQENNAGSCIPSSQSSDVKTETNEL